jgi:HEPN domain-containing protein
VNFFAEIQLVSVPTVSTGEFRGVKHQFEQTSESLNMATKTSDQPALAFFIRAQEYLSAADELLRSPKRPKAVNGWWHPIYFCYSHAVELALKAFGRSYNPEVEYGHPLTELYEKCREKGLVIDENESGYIIRLLDGGNEDSGYRYFIREGMVADLDWTKKLSCGYCKPYNRMLLRPRSVALQSVR